MTYFFVILTSHDDDVCLAAEDLLSAEGWQPWIYADEPTRIVVFADLADRDQLIQDLPGGMPQYTGGIDEIPVDPDAWSYGVLRHGIE